MIETRQVVATFGFSLALTFAICAGDLMAVEFSPEAIALPFPPDARELEIVDWTREISFKSSSSLESLGAFYLTEMADRGWEIDESSLKTKAKSIQVRFTHDACRIELDLRRKSKEVIAHMECRGLKYTDINDPAKLVAAGIPVPPAPLFLQKELALDTLAQDIDYTHDGCTIIMPSEQAEAFKLFFGLIDGLGFRQTRKPIIGDSLHATEFQKGSAELGLAVYSHEKGARIILKLADSSWRNTVPPLPPVDSLSIGKPGSGDSPVAAKKAAKSPAKKPIDVTANKGSVTVSCEAKKYTFANVASYREKGSPSCTKIVFSAQPIPYDRIQAGVSKKLDFSFHELYDFDLPNYFMLSLGPSCRYSLSVPGIGVGRSIEESENEVKIEAGRIRGSFKMLPDDDDGWQISFTATIDAAIIVPGGQIAEPGTPVEPSDRPIQTNQPLRSDLPFPMPPGAKEIRQEGSTFFKNYSALVAMTPSDVVTFYFKELVWDDWTPTETSGTTMQFEKESMKLSLVAKQQGDATALEIVTRDVAGARQQGLIPEPGKARLVLANAHPVGVVFTIGKSDYPVTAGRGAQDFKRALSYSVKPGKYKIVIKIPGQEQQTETIEVTEGSTWAIVTLPTGGFLPTRLY